MSSSKSNLRFVVKSNNHNDILTTISGSPGTIQDIEDSINAFAKKHKELPIYRSNIGFEVTAKAYMALQNVIYEQIK